MGKLEKTLTNPKRSLSLLLRIVGMYDAYVFLHNSFTAKKGQDPNRSEISDHLPAILTEAAGIKPSLIVELGAGNGESTLALGGAAKQFGSNLVSVDIRDCSGVSAYEGWSFVQKDDIKFASEFEEWCRKRGIKPKIDVLFIDTSHMFEHTVKEIECWFPFLSDKSKVIFHDTNLRTVYFRKDGSAGLGWDNERGVIRALETYFGRTFDEKRDFTDFQKGWAIRHFANCNGLTILERS